MWILSLQAEFTPCKVVSYILLDWAPLDLFGFQLWEMWVLRNRVWLAFSMRSGSPSVRGEVLYADFKFCLLERTLWSYTFLGKCMKLLERWKSSVPWWEFPWMCLVLFRISRWPIVNSYECSSFNEKDHQFSRMRQSSGAVLACSVTLKMDGEYLAVVLYLQSRMTALLYNCFTEVFFNYNVVSPSLFLLTASYPRLSRVR